MLLPVSVKVFRVCSSHTYVRILKPFFCCCTDLNITAIDVHASDHAALGGHIRPINHLLAVVKVQSYSIVQALSKHRSCISLEPAITSTPHRRRFTRLSRHFKGTSSICRPHLFEQCVIGSIQVELPQVIAVSEDQEGLLICREGDVSVSGFALNSWLSVAHLSCFLPEVDLHMVGFSGLRLKPSTHRQRKLPCVLMQRCVQG